MGKSTKDIQSLKPGECVFEHASPMPASQNAETVPSYPKGMPPKVVQPVTDPTANVSPSLVGDPHKGLPLPRRS